MCQEGKKTIVKKCSRNYQHMSKGHSSQLGVPGGKAGGELSIKINVNAKDYNLSNP